MNLTIFDFVKAYEKEYDVKEDDFTANDTVYIEMTWYHYADTGHFPDYMRPKKVK